MKRKFPSERRDLPFCTRTSRSPSDWAFSRSSSSARVPSDDLSSTTMTSLSIGTACTRNSTSSMKARSLYAGMTTETFILILTSPRWLSETGCACRSHPARPQFGNHDQLGALRTQIIWPATVLTGYNPRAFELLASSIPTGWGPTWLP